MRCPCLKPAHSRLHLESPNLPSPPSRTNARPIQLDDSENNLTGAGLPVVTTAIRRSRKDCLPSLPHSPPLRGGWGGGKSICESHQSSLNSAFSIRVQTVNKGRETYVIWSGENTDTVD